jgi:hypothetical protein
MTNIPTIRAQLLGTQYRADDIPAVDIRRNAAAFAQAL